MDAVQMYVKELKDSKSNQQETIKLFEKFKKGDINARNKIITNHTLFVYQIARKYANNGVPLGDVIQEGNLGLMKAVDKYDINHGATFGAYCRNWITQGIFRNCMMNRRIVHLPENVLYDMKDGRRDSEDFKEVSVDLPYEDGSSFAETIKDESEDISTINEETLITNNKVNTLLESLPQRECEIIKSLYGIGTVELTSQEVGEKLGLSSTRISQLANHARAQLKEVSSHKYNLNITETSEIIIVSATYGTEDVTIDITQKVIEMISSGSMQFKVSNRLGGDPCKGKHKHLYIVYTIDGTETTKKVPEGIVFNF